MPCPIRSWLVHDWVVSLQPEYDNKQHDNMKQTATNSMTSNAKNQHQPPNNPKERLSSAANITLGTWNCHGLSTLNKPTYLYLSFPSCGDDYHLEVGLKRWRNSPLNYILDWVIFLAWSGDIPKSSDIFYSNFFEVWQKSFFGIELLFTLATWPTYFNTSHL